MPAVIVLARTAAASAGPQRVRAARIDAQKLPPRRERCALESARGRQQLLENGDELGDFYRLRQVPLETGFQTLPYVALRRGRGQGNHGNARRSFRRA